MFSLYPNPANSQLNCEFKYIGESISKIEIINAYGQSIISKSLKLGNGINNMEFDISNFSKGIYYFKIFSQDGKINQIKKFVKQ